MDETGIDQQMRNDKVWTKKGNKVYGNKFGSFRGRTSVIAGYKRKSDNENNHKDDNNKPKLIAPFHFNGHTNSKVFLSWLDKNLLPVWNKEDFLIMDNASWHKTEEVKKFLKNNNIKYIYQPPYSPDLNPIEHCWANLKRKMKKLENEIGDFYKRLDWVLL
jgi:transposase